MMTFNGVLFSLRLNYLVVFVLEWYSFREKPEIESSHDERSIDDQILHCLRKPPYCDSCDLP
jgi:hypothetical protein